MVDIKIELNHASMEELLKSDEVRSALEDRARRVLAAAKANAPVRTGAYRDGLHVEIREHASRVVARVVGGSDHDMIVEAKHGTLARALDAAGGS